jgi:hypothetical protein
MIFLDNDSEPTMEITKSDKLNLDDLFIQKQKRQIKQINTYNKIINKINEKIRFISRRSKNNSFLWYNVPLVVLGYTEYDANDCIAYIVIKMEENGFSIQFIQPNTLFISWAHWVPTYVRNEIKKRTGIILDNNGNQIKTVEEETSPDNLLMASGNKGGSSSGTADKKGGKKYTPIIPY